MEFNHKLLAVPESKHCKRTVSKHDQAKDFQGGINEGRQLYESLSEAPHMNPRIVSRKILCTYCQLLKELSSSHDASGSRTYSELQRNNLVTKK